jgi:hypothetical protein
MQIGPSRISFKRQNVLLAVFCLSIFVFMLSLSFDMNVVGFTPSEAASDFAGSEVVGNVEIGKPVQWVTVAPADTDEAMFAVAGDDRILLPGYATNIEVYYYDSTAEVIEEAPIAEDLIISEPISVVPEEPVALPEIVEEIVVEAPVETPESIVGSAIQDSELVNEISEGDGFTITGAAVSENVKSSQQKKLAKEKYTVFEVENKKEIIFSDEFTDQQIADFEISYETPAPTVEEVQLGSDRKQVKISSDIHYTNILTYTDIINTDGSKIKLYWYKDGERVDVTNDIDIDLVMSDQDGDDLIDHLQWNTPHLSDQVFEIEIGIEILNVYTYLVSGQTWTVLFNTNGTADLEITSPNATWTEEMMDIGYTSDEMEFVDLKCGDMSMTYQLKLVDAEGNVRAFSELAADDTFKPTKFLIEDYTCYGTSSFVNFMHIAGYAALRFDFGGVTAWAYDPYFNEPLCMQNLDCSTCIAGSGCKWCSEGGCFNTDLGLPGEKCGQDGVCSAGSCLTQCGDYGCGDDITWDDEDGGDIILEYDILNCQTEQILTITKNDTLLDCADSATTSHTLEGDRPIAINISERDNITIANCTIILHNGADYGIHVYDSYNISLINNTIHAGNHSIFISETTHVLITNNTLNATNLGGLSLYQGTVDVNVTTNNILGGTIGLDLLGVRGVRVWENQVNATNSSALSLQSPGSTYTRFNEIFNNNFTANEDHALYVFVPGYMSGNLVYNNNFTANRSAWGFDLIAAMNFTDNLFTKNAIYSNFTGISVTGVLGPEEAVRDNNTIDRSDITVANTTGLMLGSSGFNFTNNNFTVWNTSIQVSPVELVNADIINCTFNTERPSSIELGTGSGTLHMINSSFDLDEINFSSADATGEVWVGWYVDVLVKDELGAALSGVTVDAIMKNTSQGFSEATAASGYTHQKILYEFNASYTADDSNPRRYGHLLNYTINAYNGPCKWNTTELNLTETNSTTVYLELEDGDCGCTSGTASDPASDAAYTCYSELCVSGICQYTCGEEYAFRYGYGCSDSTMAWDAANGGTCVFVAPSYCDYDDPVMMDCDVWPTDATCDIGVDFTYDECYDTNGNSCDSTAGGGNFEQDGICANEEGAEVCVTSGFIVHDSGAGVFYSGTSGAPPEGSECIETTETFTGGDFLAGAKRYDDDDGEHCDDCDAADNKGEDGQCEAACGAASQCDEQDPNYDIPSGNTCGWCVASINGCTEKEICGYQTDTTFYSEDLTENVDCDDVRCDSGSCAEGYCFDDEPAGEELEKNICYYNFNCDGSSACVDGEFYMDNGWTSDEEDCNDHCIDSGQYGGPTCTTGQHIPTGAQTCYYTDTCGPTGCELTGSGTLRQYYCDWCDDSGNHNGNYCPLPGTTGAGASTPLPNNCYYDGAGDHSCEDGTVNCNLNVDTTIFGAITWAVCTDEPTADYYSQTGNDDYCFDADDTEYCYFQEDDSCYEGNGVDTTWGWGNKTAPHTDFDREMCDVTSGTVNITAAGTAQDECYYDTINSDADRSNDCSIAGCGIEGDLFGHTCVGSSLLSATDLYCMVPSANDCYYGTTGCPTDGDGWTYSINAECYGDLDGDADIANGFCYHGTEVCIQTGCTHGEKDDGPENLTWSDCEYSYIEDDNAWCYDDDTNTCYYDTSNDNCDNELGWDLAKNTSCLDPGTVATDQCYYDTGDESDACSASGCTGIFAEDVPGSCTAGAWADGAGYCWTATNCYYDATDLCADDADGWDYSSGSTSCAAGTDTCCTDTTTIWEGVGCSSAGVAGTSSDRDTSEARCISTASGCSVYDWLGAADTAWDNEYCCGDDAGSDDFEQIGVGLSACIDGSEVDSGLTSGSFIVKDGQIYSCGAVANAVYSLDNDHTSATCASVTGKYCNGDTWMTTRPEGCGCSTGSECSVSGICVDGVCEDNGCTGNVTVATNCSGNGAAYDGSGGGACVYNDAVYYCQDGEVANESSVPQFVDDCALATWQDYCDDDVGLPLVGYVTRGICGGSSFGNCLTNYAADELNDASAPDIGTTNSDAATVCGSNKGFYCDDVSDFDWNPGTQRCDEDDNVCDACDAGNIGDDGNCEDVCGDQIAASDEKTPSACDGSTAYVGADCTYTDEGDTLEEACDCIKGSSPSYWNLGGNESATTCCDDAGENRLTRLADAGMDGYNSDSADDACCSESNDCVNESVCYSNTNVSADVDEDGDNDFCNAGTWYDCNTNTQCDNAYYCLSNDCLLSDLNVTYQDPTPNTSVRQIANQVTINVSVNSSGSNIETCTLEWNGVNETMTKIGSGTDVYCNTTKTTVDGTEYDFRVYANNTVGTENNETNRTFLENTEPITPTGFIPTAGTWGGWNETMLLNCSGSEDGDADEFNYTIDSNITGSWTTLAENLQLGNYTLNISTYTSIAGADFICYAYDAWENSTNKTAGANVDIDNRAPQYSNPVTNQTPAYIGNALEFNLTWTESEAYDLGLAGYIFSTNDSGSWVNYSYIPITGSEVSANYTIELTATNGNSVGWRYFMNDTRGNINESEIFIYNVGTKAIALQLSGVESGISWTDAVPAVTEEPADGNNGAGETTYVLNVFDAEGLYVDLSVAANDSLRSGVDTIDLANEKLAYNLTDATVNSDNSSLTTDFADNPIGTALAEGSNVYLKFYVTIPANQASGVYANNITFRGAEA